MGNDAKFTPCPFCGGKEVKLISRKRKSAVDGVLDVAQDKIMGRARDTHSRHVVICMDGDCRGWHPQQQVKQLYMSAEVAIERWNHRPTESALLEALKPFANFACDLDEGEECACHNCKARAAIALALGEGQDD